MGGTRGQRGVAGSILIACIALAALIPTPALAALDYVESSPESPAEGTQGYYGADCSPGTYVVGGGSLTTGGFSDASLVESIPESDKADGRRDGRWTARVDVVNGPLDVYVFGICDSVLPKYREAHVLVSDSEERSKRVNCPPGTNVYGGGYGFAPISDFGNFDEWRVRMSRPFDDGDAGNERDDGWEANMYYYGGGLSRALIVHAVCGSKDTTTVQKARDAADGSLKTVTAQCPAGERVTGGGARVSGTPFFAWLDSTLPYDDDSDDIRDDGWSSYANNGTGSQQRLTTYAVCR